MNRPYFPIYRSTDYGGTWTRYSQIVVRHFSTHRADAELTSQDTQHNWGLRYQPHMIQLKSRIGKYVAGTILVAGLAVPPNLNATKIDVYASSDLG